VSSSRDFVTATIADALLPVLRRPVEDVIYETIDDRQIPTRTDFTEIRDLVNSLRGQLTGATGGVKRLAETVDELDERLEALEGRGDALAALQKQVADQQAALVALAADLADVVRAQKASPQPAVTEASAPKAAAPAPATAPAGCQVDDCARKVRARGFCAKHYQQWRRGTLDGFDSPDA
jgi:hypothetical protein